MADNAFEKKGRGENNYDAASIEKFIKEFDSLINKDMPKEAEELLCRTLEGAIKSGAWGTELSVLNEMSGFYRINSDEEKGLKAANEAIELIRKRRMAETVTAATVFLNSATTFKAFGRVKDSLPYYFEAERIYERALDRRDYRFAGLYNNMALAFTELKDFSQAESYFLKALKVLEKLPEGRLETGVTLVNMAVLYDKWGKPEEMINEALMTAKDCFDDEKVKRDAYYAFNCRKCAPTYDYYGYFLIKDELLERAERIYARNRESGE